MGKYYTRVAAPVAVLWLCLCRGCAVPLPGCGVGPLWREGCTGLPVPIYPHPRLLIVSNSN